MNMAFQEVKTAIVKADGTATVSVGPTSYGETWTTSIVGVSNTPTPPATELTNIPRAAIYLGPVGGGPFLGGTETGDFDADTSMTVVIPTQQILTAYWTGADAGSVVTLSVTGTKEIPG